MSEQQGHNHELSPQEHRALRMHHVMELNRIDEEMEPLKAKRKKIRKLAKADGFKLFEIDAAHRLLNLEDPNIFVDELNSMIDIAKSFNVLPPGEQGDLFPDRRPSQEKSFDAGKVAGLAAHEPKAPDGLDEQKWMEGWHAGQEEMAAALKASMERKNAAKQDETEVIPGEEDDAPLPE